MNAFKKMRLLSGKTIKEVVEETSLGYNNILRWEKGESKPKANVLPVLAKAYKCEIENFLSAYEKA